MLFKKLPLDGSYEITMELLGDNRGHFARSWCKNEFEKLGLDSSINQINVSYSKLKGTIRGLHFQYPPNAEVKIVRCVKGKIWDVIVDLRYGSNSYGKYFGLELADNNKKMLYVPKGFAHGFQTLTDDTELLYLHSRPFSKKDEGGLNFNDRVVGIKWPLKVTELSNKDKNNPGLKAIKPVNI